MHKGVKSQNIFTLYGIMRLEDFRMGVNQKRNEIVIKSNELIRDTRYSLSEKDQKILIYLISQIPYPNDENVRNEQTLAPITIDIKDYCEVAGIYYSGKNLKDVQDSIKGLADKSWWIPFESLGESRSELFRWISKASILGGKRIKVQLNKELEPFLINLKEKFTKYELINVLTLHGKYTIRLYEILKSYLWLREWTVDITVLKDMINCKGYEQFKEFKRNVLEKSLKEINDFTDMQVDYEPIRRGRKISEIKFTIDDKQGVQINMDMLERRAHRLKEKMVWEENPDE